MADRTSLARRVTPEYTLVYPRQRHIRGEEVEGIEGLDRASETARPLAPLVDPVPVLDELCQSVLVGLFRNNVC